MRRKSIDGEYRTNFLNVYHRIEKHYEDHNLDFAVKEIAKLYELKRQVKELSITLPMKKTLEKIER
jgi:hypothetical protein